MVDSVILIAVHDDGTYNLTSVTRARLYYIINGDKLLSFVSSSIGRALVG
jgi:hypothetical protein